MGDGDESAKLIKQSGWRQGAILSEGLVNELLEHSQLPEYLLVPKESGERENTLSKLLKWISRGLSGLSVVADRRIIEDSVLVTISHDCDITNESYDREPFAELLAGKLITDSERDGGLEWGKNSRALILPIPENPFGNVFIRFDATKRFCVPRRLLASHRPISDGLTSESIYLLSAWVAKRFVRRAFPDEFNRRIAKATTKLRSQFKTKGDVLSGIYILVSDEEIEDDYEIIIWGTMKDEVFDNPEQRRQATALIDQVGEKLDNCDGIVVNESQVIRESDFSLTDLRLMKRWDFDDLTMRDYEDRGESPILGNP